MTDVAYELVYYRFFSAGDVARLVLDYAGANYKNVFVNRESMDAIKADQRFGKVPRLTIKAADGSEKHLWESRAIQEYIADVFNLFPSSDPFDRADSIAFVCSLYEIFDMFQAIWLYPSLDARRMFWTRLKNERVLQTLRHHEKHLAINSASGMFYHGTRYTTCTSVVVGMRAHFPQIHLPDLVLYALWLRLETMFGQGSIVNEVNTPQISKLVQACDAGKPGEWAKERRDFGAAKWNMEEIKWELDYS
ncbi:hypothetical protein BKA62DRAFT_719153 [Auriculariales sp. MPI-PUGE-AT-0066]|nr:hypothetical protein BKA62DRAFT_719153 [Auriculariales sp. MPI-PUGE-AT-0066]